ncbi:PREDICTED: NAD kinase 2, mitochondrial-like [Priapulus caudatus]|uniref:NAD kinase 2, mitochondrial n=1 Tax=Priapulus caudatus TaxID=37621 RepID=A0ABM1DQ32_PRICU|nr:PREDICTED: NAD kinase 2, mitochondrial-like [Priapulus caudatus]
MSENLHRILSKRFFGLQTNSKMLQLLCLRAAFKQAGASAQCECFSTSVNELNSRIPKISETVQASGGFRPSKALVLTKLTRYEFEKRRHSAYSEPQLIRNLESKGSDYKSLLQIHNNHQRAKDIVVACLQKEGIETRVVSRFGYVQEAIDWADVVFTSGGDGTFLLGASKILSRDKPIIGVTSDTKRSEGRLCLPKALSENFSEALARLLRGDFKWQWRQRIRLTMTGRGVNIVPIEFHNHQLNIPELRYFEHMREHLQSLQEQEEHEGAPVPSTSVVLPVRVLNEVFLGESLSSRVSYYEVSVDNWPSIKQKSSGLTVSTGTGSSSWHFNINRLTAQSAEQILRIACKETGCDIDFSNIALVQGICQKFNDDLNFDAAEPRMAYTVRDPIINSIFPATPSKGFAKTMTVRSRCWDACIVVDGGLSFIFNDGAMVHLEILPEDALKTVSL